MKFKQKLGLDFMVFPELIKNQSLRYLLNNSF